MAQPGGFAPTLLPNMRRGSKPLFLGVGGRVSAGWVLLPLTTIYVDGAW